MLLADEQGQPVCTVSIYSHVRGGCPNPDLLADVAKKLGVKDLRAFDDILD